MTIKQSPTTWCQKVKLYPLPLHTATLSKDAVCSKAPSSSDVLVIFCGLFVGQSNNSCVDLINIWAVTIDIEGVSFSISGLGKCGEPTLPPSPILESMAMPPLDEPTSMSWPLVERGVTECLTALQEGLLTTVTS